MHRSVLFLIGIALIAAGTVAQQPNSAAATATWAGINHAAAGTGPINVNFTSTVIAFQVSGAPNAPWIWAESPGPALPAGIPTGFGLVDINVFAGITFRADGLSFSTGTLLDLMANTGPVGQTNFTFPVCNPYLLTVNSHQCAVVDPASAAGITATAASTLNLTCGRFQLIPHGDDTTVQIVQGPFCPTTVFYDTAYTSFFSNSNGSVTFGAGDTVFTESQAGFNTGRPRIAACWDDLYVGQAGSFVTYTETVNGWRVKWNGVPEFVNVGANTMEIAYDCATGAITCTYGAMSLADGLVGITPGTSLAVPITTFPSLKNVTCGGAFAGYNATGLESVNALYAAGFDLVGCTVSYTPFNFGIATANSYIVN